MAEVRSGELVQLSPLVRRLTANNPSVMTGAGTNCYLIGTDELAILDPGPADPVHIEAILAAVGAAKVRWIVVTHTHPDHSPAAKLLAEKTGAQLVGAVLPQDEHQDVSFSVECNLQHGDLIQGAAFTLEAIATPGHVANHFCYLLQEEGALFTGDHIMEGSTVVIVPPGGDMADYMHSLALLKQYPVRSLLPGHGDVMREPWTVIDGLITHRLQREQKVIAVLRTLGKGTIGEITPAVYDNVDASLHWLAEISLWAHLLKLDKEGRARRGGDFERQAFNTQCWYWMAENTDLVLENREAAHYNSPPNSSP
ncbi:MAG TPA: MBL fold metallo-hydrolase [Pseudomonadales bacterium]|nr:MBL fold metallo-hydrolase [Pseudomonadales bacterium]HRG50097.1 MBL fold metallo-hydrolase [Pseudomonadales bacterium]